MPQNLIWCHSAVIHPQGQSARPRWPYSGKPHGDWAARIASAGRRAIAVDGAEWRWYGRPSPALPPRSDNGVSRSVPVPVGQRSRFQGGPSSLIPSCTECNSLQFGKRDRAHELLRGQLGRRLNARQTAMSPAHRGLLYAAAVPPPQLLSATNRLPLLSRTQFPWTLRLSQDPVPHGKPCPFTAQQHQGR